MVRLFMAIVLACSSLAHAAEFSVVRKYVLPVIVSQQGTQPGLEVVVSSGSGVVIASGYMLTAAHVVPDTPRESMYVLAGGRQLKAKPIKIDRTRDLALLSVAVACPCASISVVAPQIDEQVYSVGFPLYSTYRVQLLSYGLVQGVVQDNLVSTTVTAPGGSGGGLFAKVEDEYQLVGVTVAIASASLGPRVMNLEQEYNWLSFSVPVEVIRNFLRNTPVIPR